MLPISRFSKAVRLQPIRRFSPCFSALAFNSTFNSSKKKWWIVALGGAAALAALSAQVQAESEPIDVGVQVPWQKDEEKRLPPPPPGHSEPHQAEAVLIAPGSYDAIIDGVVMFCLTGGPCGGKSTALVNLSERFRSLGFQVYNIPEHATIFFNSGVAPPKPGDDHEQFARASIVWQANRIKTQIAMEDAYYAIAKNSRKPTVILCDRGTMDAKAYMSEKDWRKMLEEYGWDEVTLRDRRYDAVVHLVTAAIGAETFYTTANNSARSETIEEARLKDRACLESWIGHPHLKIIGNQEDFASKVRRVSEFFSSLLELPKAVRPSAFRRKFVVKVDIKEAEAKLFNGLPVINQEFSIQSSFLKNTDPNRSTILRSREAGGVKHYSITNRTAPDPAEVKDKGIRIANAQATVVQEILSENQYLRLMALADSQLKSVKSRSRCFVWNNRYYELESFSEEDGKESESAILVVEMDEEEERRASLDTIIPPFLKTHKEVTGVDTLQVLASKGTQGLGRL